MKVMKTMTTPASAPLRTIVITMLLPLVAGTHTWAQTLDGRTKGELVPLNIQVTISRYAGDEVVSSLPYMLSVTADEQPRESRLNMGADIPIVSIAPVMGADGKPLPGMSTGGGPFEYRAVGVIIECIVTRVAEDRYQVRINFEESSVYGDEQPRVQNFRPTGIPVLRSYQSSNSLLLRDGQTTQYTAATDRLTGETVRIDVTLTVSE